MGSHAVSFAERLEASRIVGLVEGHDTGAGAYPPDGESGNARLMAANATAAYSSAFPSRGRTIVDAGSFVSNVMKVLGKY